MVQQLLTNYLTGIVVQNHFTSTKTEFASTDIVWLYFTRTWDAVSIKIHYN